jgi:hypothetical protein
MQETKATQRMRIFDYCQKHGSITIREAFENLHINSPSKRISEMRHSDMFNVQCEVEKRTNSAGDEVRYKRYYITMPEWGVRSAENQA